MEKDLRLTNQEDYLKNEQLYLSKFQESKNSDHKHCSFCWSKFSTKPNDLHVGYATSKGKHWICPACFNDFKEMFNWEVIEE